MILERRKWRYEIFAFGPRAFVIFGVPRTAGGRKKEASAGYALKRHG
jgi:hypothetical protein